MLFGREIIIPLQALIPQPRETTMDQGTSDDYMDVNFEQTPIFLVGSYIQTDCPFLKLCFLAFNSYLLF
jgi:hypothetical protein